MKAMLSTVLQPARLRRTATAAAIVGTWLTLFNQADVLLTSPWTWSLGGKVLLNYLTPFVVANVGLLSRAKETAE